MELASLLIHGGQGIKGHQVVEVLEGLRLFKNAKPKKIQVDNGPELQSTHEHRLK